MEIGFLSSSTLQFWWLSMSSFTHFPTEDKNTGRRGLRLAINSNTTAVNQGMHHKLQPVLTTSCGRHLLVTKVFTCLNNQLHCVWILTSPRWTAATWATWQVIHNSLTVDYCYAHERTWRDSLESLVPKEKETENYKSKICILYNQCFFRDNATRICSSAKGDFGLVKQLPCLVHENIKLYSLETLPSQIAVFSPPGFVTGVFFFATRKTFILEPSHCCISCQLSRGLKNI